MSPPLTLQSYCPQESVTASESTLTQVFGVMYITLTGLIDSMHQSCGRPCLQDPRAVYLQVPRNPPQAGSLTPLAASKYMTFPKNISPEKNGCIIFLEELSSKRPSCATAILPPQKQGNMPVQILISQLNES
ncbi:hypothetical protein DSO57_1033398 [Entomophthora muscae]|uniref:Uncharacterized protein n=1 Tax=Entomophthora muscae TaxID=34485 RepID=A0ACC2S297_9FUNG|nr:hypothetical protein DSO57_1033398 [Entomophthora muscae]